MLPSSSSLLLFVSAALVVLIIPGPAVFYIVGRSIGLGRRAGLVSVLGLGVGSMCHVIAATTGLSALMLSSAAAFGFVKYLGAAYLIYLGIQKLRSGDGLEPSGAIKPATLRRVFGEGAVVNLLNPKIALFFFAFIPQFVNPLRGHVTEQILFFGLLYAFMGIVTDSIWALAAGSVAQQLRTRLSWRRGLRYASGGILISLGVAAAFAGAGKKN